MILALAAMALARDAWGVPMIEGDSWAEVFRQSGYAAAEDRLWQMENSRRLARGQMSEVFGDSFRAADRETLRLGYSEAELQVQIDSLSARGRAAFAAYAEGVNQFIAVGKLPSGYAENGFAPRPWTPVDSAAIAVNFLQRFGRGGAGEIRNLALYLYLKARPNLRGRELDVVDDLAWFNDPTATTTVPRDEDPLRRNPPSFSLPSRRDTERHLAELPPVNLLELLPALRLAERAATTQVAMNRGVAYKTGSYAIVVGPSRSATGVPMLLSAPQMGFSNPVVVHEQVLRGPGLRVTGMTLPGLPGVLIGMTDQMAWGLTTGVADTEDISYVAKADARPVEDSLTLKTKAGSETVTRKRIQGNPVVFETKTHYFVRRSSFMGRELRSMDSVYALYANPKAAEIERLLGQATLNFNFFFARKDGEVGYRYAGQMPIRSAGWDPRFPTPLAAEWKGFLSPDQMPHLVNPPKGLLANWNNKPAAWWPNLDTPAWGRIFRDSVLREALKAPKLRESDLELAAWQIARRDETYEHFHAFLRYLGDSPDERLLKAYDGWLLEGSRAAGLYQSWIEALREELFMAHLGNLNGPDNFRTALQPSLILRALEGKTKFNYLGKRSAAEIVRSAFATAKTRAKDYRASSIRWAGLGTVPYQNRGTYIQIISLGETLRGRNVLPPGNASEGPHAADQMDLAKTWTFKSMITP